MSLTLRGRNVSSAAKSFQTNYLDWSSYLFIISFIMSDISKDLELTMFGSGEDIVASLSNARRSCYTKAPIKGLR